MANELDLEAMATANAKMLKWTAFLVLISLGILVIDLQLKRSIGRQAVAASLSLSNATAFAEQMRKAAHGRGEAAGAGRDTDHGSAPGSAGVVAGTGMAASTDPGADAGPVVEGAAPAGPRKRTTGNGRRASRPESGS